MNKQILNTKELINVFKDTQAFDPKINIKNRVIMISPFYWNFCFITNFFPVFCSLYVFTQNVEIKVFILFLLLILGAFFIIWTQLKYYNKIIIDTELRKIKILPNLISKIFFNEKNISYEDIKAIDYYSDGFWLAYRRYIIVIILNEKSQKLKIISTENKNNAAKIVKAFRTII